MLSHTAANFFAWKTYFGLLFREYDLLDHIDSTVDLLTMAHEPDWSTIDATIIRWFFQTVSTDIFHTVVHDGDTACDVWKKITGLFTDNKIQCMTFLQQEFFGLHQNDLSLDAFCMRLKTLSNELHDLEFPITNALLLSTLAAGLGEDLSHTASNLMLLTTPTYEQAVAYLRNEERRLKHLWAHAAHTAFIAGFSPGAPAPSSTGLPPRAMAPYYPPSSRPPPFGPAEKTSFPTMGGSARACSSCHGQQRRERRQRRSPVSTRSWRNGSQRNGNPPPPQQSMPLPPWATGQHPWTGVVHAYTMPVPRAPYPGVLGPRLATHQAFFMAPPPGAPLVYTPPPSYHDAPPSLARE
jgi:hypothetical protein